MPSSNHTGHDIKSLLLNLSSIIIILVPIGWLVFNDNEEYKKMMLIASGVSLVLALLAPPVGWRRPHPYSDDPTNFPFAPFTKSKKAN